MEATIENLMREWKAIWIGLLPTLKVIGVFVALLVIGGILMYLQYRAHEKRYTKPPQFKK
jgi:hypothetical protein